MTERYPRQHRWSPAHVAASTVAGLFLLPHLAMSQVELPVLSYSTDALEPYISNETVQYHYGKHHAAYVNNLNAFIEADDSLANKTLEYIMKNTEGTIFNNAAQVWNHNFYWQSLSPSGGGEPDDDLYDDLVKSFGSYDNFMGNFTSFASGHFGSGWAWLVQNSDGSLEVVDTHDASNPIVECLGNPLLTYDVWEHAYYIDYRNSRSDYIEVFWNLVDWDFANDNYLKAWRSTSKSLPSVSTGSGSSP